MTEIQQILLKLKVALLRSFTQYPHFKLDLEHLDNSLQVLSDRLQQETCPCTSLFSPSQIQ